MAGVVETAGFHLVPAELCMSGTPVVLTFMVQPTVPKLHLLLWLHFLLHFWTFLKTSTTLCVCETQAGGAHSAIASD